MYDTENGETTRCFIKALQGFLPELKFKDFREANDYEKKSLHTITVVRHIAPRCIDYLDQIEQEVKQNLAEANVYDLGRVTVIYFYVNESEKVMNDEIKQISRSGKYPFAKIVVMDFVDKTLIDNTFSLERLFSNEQINANARQETLDFILSKNIKMTLFVGVFFDERLPKEQEDQFLEVLRKSSSTSFHLKSPQTFDKFKEISSPTVIYTSGPLTVFHEKITGKDLRKVMFFHIIEIPEKSSTPYEIKDDCQDANGIQEKQDPPEVNEISSDSCSRLKVGHFWKVFLNEEKFYMETSFHEQFEEKLVATKE